MTILAGAKVDAADFGGVAGAWTAYTPTFTNVTGGAGVFAYMLVGKTLFLRGQFSAGTVTALGVVGVSIPAGMTMVAGTALAVPCISVRTQRSCLANSSNNNLLEISNSDGTNLAAAAALANTRWTGVVEIQ